MKILAPANSAAEAAALIGAGAGEIYCGLQPSAWNKRHGEEVWLNRRGPGAANTGSQGELKELVKTAHSLGVPVFLTMNMPFYPPGLYSEIVDLAREAAGECGADALIVADPGLVIAFREAGINAGIHISSLAAVLNSASADFFRGLGAGRIIFPRYMDLEELRLIIAKTGPEMEYEVFILNDGCVFEEGYCHVSHAFGGAFCHQTWRYRLVKTDEGEICPPKRESFDRHLADYRRWTWFIRNCGGGFGPGGFPLGMCGLCALPELHGLGVCSLKIVGREAPLAKKTASVRLVRRVLDMVEAGENEKSVKAKARRIRGTPDLCGSGYMCYYR